MENFKKILSFVIVILFVFIFYYFLFNKNDFSSKIVENNIQYVKIGGEIIKVELALTIEEQEKGLSGRNILKEDEGMLFIFKEPRINYFWMKEIKFPIDIIWIDENFKIIYIKKTVLPESYPMSFGPDQKSKYVLEVLAGFSEKNNLKENNQIEFLPEKSF